MSLLHKAAGENKTIKAELIHISNLKDGNGKTALEYAIQYDWEEEYTHILLSWHTSTEVNLVRITK